MKANLLPIESILPQLIESIQTQNVLLVAPPGAGKSTFLPLQLLKQAQFANSKIIMLQPRRVAARAIAEYLAEQLGEAVGQTVGYRMRGEQNVGPDTRLEVVTEGLLTRKLQQDPELADVGLLIFDEFHERSMHADFSLALSIETQQALRDDLRLLVMSATLEVEPLNAILPNAKVLQSEGRAHPVELRYLGDASQDYISKLVRLLPKVLDEGSGSILVFLPGAFEIKKVQVQLQSLVNDNVKIYPLYGQLNKQIQKKALAKTKQGERKIVLATNIAETSLTIDGISVVIDTGLEKVARFNLKKHITQLTLQSISQASAEQRAGRAGRLGPGVCYRLWSAEKQDRLAKQSQPQIRVEDITALVLQSLAWGSRLEKLALLDQPSDAQLSQANDLLTALQALNTQQELTSHGRALAKLPCHPRLANMLLRAQQLGSGVQLLACMLVAVLENTQALPLNNQVSLSAQIASLLNQASHPLLQQARRWASRLKLPWQPSQVKACQQYLSVLVGLAYPDFLAKQRSLGSFQLAKAGGAALSKDESFSAESWLAVASLMLGKHADARITLAEPISLATIRQHFPHLIVHKKQCAWQQNASCIKSEEVTYLGDIVVDRTPSAKPVAETIAHIWRQQLHAQSLSILPWTESATQLRHRIALANKHSAQSMPAADEQSLLEEVDDWLIPFMQDKTRLSELEKLDLCQLLLNRMDWDQQQKLERICPHKISLPTGRDAKLTYQADGQVLLKVKMQEVYGLPTSPTVINGKVSVIVELLSPAGRPIQTTSDLAGFWQGSYKQVQKEMKGRYPKHFWPDDPANAQATTKTKKYM